MSSKRQFEDFSYLLTTSFESWIVSTLKTTITQHWFVNIHVTSNTNVIECERNSNDIRRIVASIMNIDESNDKLHRKIKIAYRVESKIRSLAQRQSNDWTISNFEVSINERSINASTREYFAQFRNVFKATIFQTRNAYVTFEISKAYKAKVSKRLKRTKCRSNRNDIYHETKSISSMINSIFSRLRSNKIRRASKM